MVFLCFKQLQGGAHHNILEPLTNISGINRLVNRDLTVKGPGVERLRVVDGSVSVRFPLIWRDIYDTNLDSPLYCVCCLHGW